MPTFIKPGFWEKRQKGFNNWLNLDQLITSLSPTPTPTGVFDYTTTTSILPALSPETVIRTMLIPANTFSNLDWLALKVCMYQNVFSGAFFNFYINSSTSLIGATKLMAVSYDGVSSTNGYNAVNDNIFLKNNKIIGFFESINSSLGYFPSIYYNSAIDLTANNYIIITYSNANIAGCNVNIESVILQKTN